MLPLLLLIQHVLCGQISTWDFKYTYDIEGNLAKLAIPIKLDNALQAGAYLHFGGAILHKLSMAEVKFEIQNLAGIKLDSGVASTVTQPAFLTHYFFGISSNIPSREWLWLFISPSSVVSGFYSEPVVLRTLSSLDDQAMEYDSNYAAGHLNIADLPPSGMTVVYSVNTLTYPNYQQPGASYVMAVDITSRVEFTGVQIVLSIVKGMHTDGLGENDFVFIDKSCSLEQYDDYKCSVDAKGQSITIQTGGKILANQQTHLKFAVQNPLYVSTRDLRLATIASLQGGKMMEKGFKTNVFQVHAVSTQTKTVKYLWGIDYQEDLTDTYVNIFAAENPSVVQGPYNSIKVSFTVGASISLIYSQVVQIKLSCTHALSAATKHNLPAYDESGPVYCKYTSPYIECFNVGTLTPSTEYYISTKAYYASSATISDFASVSFYLKQTDTLNVLTIYSPSAGVLKNVDTESHMLDIGGWHGSTGSLSYTQVSSIPVQTLEAVDLKNTLGNQGTVGISVSTTPSSLLFFLKTTTAQICGLSAVAADPCSATNINNKYLKMTIMVNSLMVTSNQFLLPKKLNYIANDGGGVYQDDNFKCLSSGFCDIGTQNNYAIYTGMYSQYGVASFECGKLSGSATLLTDCFNLQGTVAGVGSNGIISLPTITFPSTFQHSSQYADEQLLDFVITFYRGDIVSGAKPSLYTRVSSHLINGYTITALQSPKISFINYYMGNTQGNNGWRIPTMLRVQVPPQTKTYDRVQIFFDSSIKLFTSDNYGCSAVCYAYDTSTYSGYMDNWILQSSVMVAGSNDFLIPILPTGIPKTLYVVLLSSINEQTRVTSVPAYVYRVYGAAIKSESRIPLLPIGGLVAQVADLGFPYNGANFNLQMDPSTITTGYSVLTFKTTTASTLTLEINTGNYIGAGLTLVSIGQDIFKDAELSSYFGLVDCFPTFSYNTYANIALDVNANLPRYVKFCPFAGQISFPFSVTSATTFEWPQNFKLSTMFAYAVSAAKGQMQAAILDLGVVSRLLNICKLSATNTISANSLGQQRIKFPIQFTSKIQIGSPSYSSVRITISMPAAITGLNILTTTTVCQIEGLSKVVCSYTTTATDIIVVLTPQGIVDIPKNTLITLIFRIRSTYGLTVFGTNQIITVKIELPSIDVGTSQTMLYGNGYSVPATINEQCTYPKIELSTIALGQSFNLSQLKLQVYNKNAIGQVSWEFSLGSSREFVAADSTFIQFNMGFMRDQNMDATKYKCQIYDLSTLQLSTIFSKIDRTALPLLRAYFIRDIPNPQTYKFKMVCDNFRTPGSTYSTEAFSAALIDIVGFTVVQSSLSIIYDGTQYLPLSGVTGTQVDVKLIAKTLNSPGFGSVYTLKLQNGALLLDLTHKINIKFHSGISALMNRIGVITCRMGDVYCYCYIVNNLIQMDVCTKLEPLAITNITIGQIAQPNTLFWPTTPTVWVGVDTDTILSNGLYFQSTFTDVQGDVNQVQPMEIVETLLSSNFIRTNQNHKITVLLPSGSVSQDNEMYIQFPVYYADRMQKAQITCSLLRSDDQLKTNYATTCIIFTGTVVKIITGHDGSNNLIKQYTISIENVPLPSKEVPPTVLNDYQLNIHIVQKGNTKVKFSSAFYYSPKLTLQKENKENVFWSGSSFQYLRDGTLTVTGETYEIVPIYRGVFRTMMQLHPNVTSNNMFIQTFGYGLEDKQLQTYPTTLSCDSGTLTGKLLIGASKDTTRGYQVFNLNKQTGGEGYVSVLPSIYGLVVDQPCQLTTDQLIYNIQYSGNTQPIIIDVHNCYPMSDLRIELINNHPEFEVLSVNPQNIQYDPSIIGNTLLFNKYLFIFQITNLDSSPILGTQFQFTFNVSGVSFKYYIPPPPIKLQIVDANYDVPVVTLSKAPVAFKNTIKFYFTCSQDATLYWALGIGGDIEYIQPQEIQNKTIRDNTLRTQRNTTDLEWKIYGARYVQTAIEVTESFDSLKSNSEYTLIAYCINQLMLSSSPLAHSWETSFNGGKTIKLNITFTRGISELFELQLVCAVNLIFTIDPYRIYNDKGYSCDVTTLELIRSTTIASRILSTYNSTYVLQPSYYVYISADTSLMIEDINNQVKQAMINLVGFKSIVQSNMNIDPDEDPTIVDITYIEPDQSIMPNITYTKAEVASDSIRMNFTMSGAKGYLGVGVEQTDSSPSPSILQLRRSLNFLNRSLQVGYLLYYNYSSLVFNETKSVVFDHLSPNLKYRVYWFYSNDDAGPLQMVSNVSFLQLQTTANQTYTYGLMISLGFIIQILAL